MKQCIILFLSCVSTFAIHAMDHKGNASLSPEEKHLPRTMECIRYERLKVRYSEISRPASPNPTTKTLHTLADDTGNAPPITNIPRENFLDSDDELTDTEISDGDDDDFEDFEDDDADVLTQTNFSDDAYIENGNNYGTPAELIDLMPIPFNQISD